MNYCPSAGEKCFKWCNTSIATHDDHCDIFTFCLIAVYAKLYITVVILDTLA